MARKSSSSGETDRFASGTGRSDAEKTERDDTRPGVTGGGTTALPAVGQADAEGTTADSAEGTIGAVGEMDITGAPAGTSGTSGLSGTSAAGQSRGGGPGAGGATTTGGTGPGTKDSDPGPQSAASTIAFLGDRELSSIDSAGTGGAGGAGGAGGTGGAGGSDIAGENAKTDRTTDR